MRSGTVSARTTLKRLAVCLAMLLLPAAVSAQTTSTLQGTVTDKQGAAVPNVQVYVSVPPCVCADCKYECDCCVGSKSVSTNDTGDYRVSVEPGEYNVTAKWRGAVATVHVSVSTGSSTRADITIPDPTLETTVTVTAAGEVKGFVRLLGGKKLERPAKVLLIPKDCQCAACPLTGCDCCPDAIKKETDESGRFSLPAEPGKYTLVTAYENYTQVESRPVDVKVGKTNNLRIELSAPAAAAAAPGRP